MSQPCGADRRKTLSKKTKPNFNNVKNPTLRAWNRCSIFFNTIGDEGMSSAKRYVNSIDQEGKQDMWDMFADIKERGYERVNAAVSRSSQAGGTQ